MQNKLQTHTHAHRWKTVILGTKIIIINLSATVLVLDINVYWNGDRLKLIYSSYTMKRCKKGWTRHHVCTRFPTETTKKKKKKKSKQ